LGFVFVGAAFAQGTGTITGTVKDPKDALVAKATVTARNTQTNNSRTAQTDDDGRYRFDGLPIGQYEVSVESAGFAKFTQTGIGLDVNQIAVVDVAMNPEGVSGVVNVVEQNAAILNTSNAEVSTRFDSRRVSELPLAPNRTSSMWRWGRRASANSGRADRILKRTQLFSQWRTRTFEQLHDRRTGHQ